MIRILFVDDEPKITEGLQRMLRSMRREWEMTFASSGPKALEKLAAQPFDVVVSDMRMPGMDGCQLLTEVMQRHPQIIRIILSGYSDKEMVMRSIGLAHHYLSKPCEAETLKETIKHACDLRDQFDDETLRLLVARMRSLPNLPPPYFEAVQELHSSNLIEGNNG